MATLTGRQLFDWFYEGHPHRDDDWLFPDEWERVSQHEQWDTLAEKVNRMMLARERVFWHALLDTLPMPDDLINELKAEFGSTSKGLR